MSPEAIYENFRDAVFQHYWDMQGRVSRARFWYFLLACVLVGLVASLLSAVTRVPLNGLLGLLLLPPTAGMGARRLQDCGRNGGLVWALIIPSSIVQIGALLALMGGPMAVAGFFVFLSTTGWLLNAIILISGVTLLYFWVQPGERGANAYGPGEVTILPPL